MEQEEVVDREENRSDRKGGSEVGVEISVVVPVSERHDDLRDLYHEYSQEISRAGHSFEFIFVLDGPQPEAYQMLMDLKKEYEKITVVALNRWFGEAAALSVGFEKARAPLILTLSSYFQVEPFEVRRILQTIVEKGSDLIIVWRFPRIDSLFNRVQARIFHWITGILTGTSFNDISCGLRVMKRTVAEEIHLYGDLHRFFPLLAYQRGFKVEEVQVRQSIHDAKRRLYGPGVYLRRLLDILTLFFLFKFTKKPLRFFGLVGSGLFGVGTVIIGYLGLYRLLGLGGIANRPLLILGVLLMVLGVQLFSIGLLGEIIIFTHARKMEEYTVERILD